MNNIEILEDLKKYISFANKQCNFSNDADYKWHKELAGMIENLIQENKELKEKLNDRVDVKQTANSISFTMPSKVAEKYMEVLDEIALEIENKRLKKLIEKTEKDYIPKSKVKEKIEELKDNCYAESIDFNNELIEILQELLEGE